MSSHPQAGVELVQHQAHGARQVAHVRRLLIQGVLEGLKVLHPLHGEAVVDDVGLRRTEKKSWRLSAGQRVSGAAANRKWPHLVHDHNEGQFGLVEDTVEKEERVLLYLIFADFLSPNHSITHLFSLSYPGHCRPLLMHKKAFSLPNKQFVIRLA